MSRIQEKKNVKTPVLKQAIAMASASALFAAALWGCGGSGSSVGDSGSGRTRGISFSVQWPERTRLIPNSAESIRLTVAYSEGAATPGTDADCSDGHCVMVVDRSAGSETHTDIDNLPLGGYSMKAEAFTQNGGVGDIVASNGSGDAVAVLEDTTGVGTRQQIPITLGSTVDHFEVTLKIPQGDTVGTGGGVWQGVVPAFDPGGVTVTNTSMVAPEGSLFELVATARSKAGTLNLRFRAAPNDELVAMIGATSLQRGSTTANKVTAVGRFAPNAANSQIDILYRDNNGSGGVADIKKGSFSVTHAAFSSAAPVLAPTAVLDAVNPIDDVQDIDFLGDSAVTLYRANGNENRSFPGNALLAGAAVADQRYAARDAVTFQIVAPADAADVSASSNRGGFFTMLANGTIAGGTNLAVAGASFGSLAVGYGFTAAGSAVDHTLVADRAFYATRTNGGTSRQRLYLAPSVSVNFGVNILDVDSRDGFVFILLADGNMKVLSAAMEELATVNLGVADYDYFAIGKRTLSGYPVALLDKTLPGAKTAAFTWGVN